MSKVALKPLADRVLVEAAPAEEKTAGGIIIPDTAIFRNRNQHRRKRIPHYARKRYFRYPLNFRPSFFPEP